jgi:hypothetical protein
MFAGNGNGVEEEFSRKGLRLRFDGIIAALRPDLCPELVENPWNGH